MSKPNIFPSVDMDDSTSKTIAITLILPFKDLVSWLLGPKAYPAEIMTITTIIAVHLKTPM